VVVVEGYDQDMNDPRLEDHALGVELQITELVERIERARVQGRVDRMVELQAQVDVLQDDLVRTADSIAGEHWARAEIHLPKSA